MRTGTSWNVTFYKKECNIRLRLCIHPKWVGLADTNTLPAFSLRWKIQETLGSSFKLIEKIAVNREDIPSSIKFRGHREA
jgi:hypothetical protein